MSWTTVGSNILGETASDHLGHKVAISGDGSVIAISAPDNDGNGTNSGKVYVYKINGGSWVKIGEFLGGAAGDKLGESISLSDDGSVIAIGACLNDGNGTDSGHVRVYEYDGSGSSWTQIGSDLDGSAAGDLYGRSVSLSDDGSVVAIGSQNHGNVGHVQIFYKHNEKA